MARKKVAKKNEVEAPKKTKKGAPKKTTKKSAKKKENILNEAYIENIIEEMEDLYADLRKAPVVAAAAKRARKKTTQLAATFKQFRSDSVAQHKKED